MATPDPNREPHVEITNGAAKYRFYGLGAWCVSTNGGQDWHPVNAIYVPAKVMRVAAEQCMPAPSS